MDNQYWESVAAELKDAFRGWPSMPSPLALRHIGGDFGKDWKRGKEIQRDLGIEIVPPECNCEIGAGFWDRITDGGWREDKP